jgi:peptidoglycan/LPS O-acetylase OafA/YrhL
MQPGRRFFATLDGIRGIAAIIVVGVHAEPLFGNWATRENGLAVDIFFILSGVVIDNAYGHRLQTGLAVRSFAKIRLIRFYPLYIFGFALGLLGMLLGFGSITHAGYIPLALVLAILILPNPFINTLFPMNPPAWSLSNELFVNIVYAFAFRYLTTRVLGAIMAVCVLGFVGILYFGHDHTLSVGFNRAHLFGGFIRAGYSFFAGVLLYRLFASRKFAPANAWRMAFMPWVILGLVAMMLGATPPARVVPYYEFVVVVFLFPAAVYCALWFEPMGVGARVCKFLGAISYAVYVIHFPLYWLITSMLTRATGVAAENFAPWGGFCFLGVLLPICWALDKFYDGPLRAFLLTRGQSKYATVPKKA